MQTVPLFILKKKKDKFTKLPLNFLQALVCTNPKFAWNTNIVVLGLRLLIGETSVELVTLDCVWPFISQHEPLSRVAVVHFVPRLPLMLGNTLWIQCRQKGKEKITCLLLINFWTVLTENALKYIHRYDSPPCNRERSQSSFVLTTIDENLWYKRNKIYETVVGILYIFRKSIGSVISSKPPKKYPFVLFHCSLFRNEE